MSVNKLTIQLIADIFFAVNFLIDSQDKLFSTKKVYDKVFKNTIDQIVSNIEIDSNNQENELNP